MCVRLNFLSMAPVTQDRALKARGAGGTEGLTLAVTLGMVSKMKGNMGYRGQNVRLSTAEGGAVSHHLFP